MNKRRRFKAKRRRDASKRAWRVNDATTTVRILLGPRDFQAFKAAVDAPPQPNVALRTLLTSSRWS